MLELWGSPSPTPHFLPGFGESVQTQKPGELARVSLSPSEFAAPSPLPPPVPPGFGNGNGLGAQPGEVVASGDFHMPDVLSRLLSRPHEGWGVIEGCWEETPGFQPSDDFCLNQTPNPPRSPFLSPPGPATLQGYGAGRAEGPSGARMGALGPHPLPSSFRLRGRETPEARGVLPWPRLSMDPQRSRPPPLPPRSKICMGWAWASRGRDRRAGSE